MLLIAFCIFWFGMVRKLLNCLWVGRAVVTVWFMGRLSVDLIAFIKCLKLGLLDIIRILTRFRARAFAPLRTIALTVCACLRTLGLETRTFNRVFPFALIRTVAGAVSLRV